MLKIAVLFTLSALVGVATKAAEKSSPARQQTHAPASSKTNSTSGPVIQGERFTVRKIIDRQQGDLPVGVVIAPEKWRDESKVMWNYEHHSSPVKLALTIENPANEEAFFAFPAVEFFCLRPDGGYYRPGQNLGGLIYTHQVVAPAEALLASVQMLRGGEAKFKVIGTKDLPDLPKALKLPEAKNQRGVGLKVSYEWKGKAIEEEFYAVHYAIEIPYDGPLGRTWQINWGLNAPHSFRAAEGTLEKRRPVFAAIARSFRPNPAWQERLVAVNAFLREQFNRQLQAGYDQIAAAAQLSRQISANNDAMLAAIDARLQASRSSSGSASTRSANDKFSDYIRGVETVDDPFYGTSQHSYNEKYHWTDGYGSYRHSNDPTYNPNQAENGGWQLMQPTR